MPPPQNLQASLDNGCRICLTLWSHFVAELPKIDEHFLLSDQARAELSIVQFSQISVAQFLVIAPEIKPIEPFTTFRFASIWDDHIILAFSFEIGSYRTIPSHDIFIARSEGARKTVGPYEFADNTDSPATWALIQRWLADSTTSHFKCRINSSSKWLPSRLIDVGSVKDDVEPFLYVPSEDRVGGDTFLSSPEQAYITLSHCWGACQPTKLLRENYGTMRKRIRSQNLPKTFQDAISVTRHLGVRYLWIDALCIIQDSPDDWHQEATLMEKVYRNSKCTIAASGAVDGLGGCFFSRDIRLLQPFQVKASFGLLPGQMCLVVPGAKVSSRIARHTLLYQRAWVLQERLLSPRSIHFGKEQVSWECYECHASETFPYHQHSKFVNRGLQTLADLVAEVKSASELEELRSPYGLSVVWSEALTNYTSLGLTKPQDKLIALAGIATAMKPKVGDYLAGMWKCLLPFGLLWTPTAPAVEGHRSRPPQYRAPSWSWASMEGQINYTSCLYLTDDSCLAPDLFSVIEANVATVDEGGVGQVTGGFLRVNARPLRFLREQVKVNGLVGEVSAITDQCGCEWPLEPLIKFYFDTHNDAKTPFRNLLCVPICREGVFRPMRGLILGENAEAKFERVGDFSFVDKDGGIFKLFQSLPMRELVIV